MWDYFLIKVHAYTINVPIAGDCDDQGRQIEGGGGSYPCTDYNSFTDYFLDLINYAVNLAFALAVLVIVFGAFKYVTAGGDDAKAKDGKDIIVGALIGLALLLLIKLIVPLLGVSG